MADEARPRSGVRGRPFAHEHRRVAADILVAAKRCLEERAVSEVSLRDIAEAAGTDEAMISYYYGSKSALLVEIVDEAVEDVLKGLAALKDEMLADPDRATRIFVEYLDCFCRSRAPASKILISELIRTDSAVKDFNRDRWSSATSAALSETVQSLVKAGIYRSDISPEQIAFVIKGLIIYPLLGSEFGEISFPHGDPQKENWVTLVSEIMDNHLRRRDGITSPSGMGSGTSRPQH